MNYHNILHHDMRNGEGMRTVLFVSGCPHHCVGCHNPETWDPKSGIPFDFSAMDEIIEYSKDKYVSGLTISGGDPMTPYNQVSNHTWCIYEIIKKFKEIYPNKNIWIYTGYELSDIKKMIETESNDIIRNKMEFIYNNTDVFVTGPFIQSLADVNYEWAGSTNQTIYRKEDND